MANSTWFWDGRYANINGNSGVCNGGITSTFLFDIDADPHERHNLYFDPEYKKLGAELVAELHATFEDEYWHPTYDFASPKTDEAMLAFGASGGYVAPWGCQTQ